MNDELICPNCGTVMNANRVDTLAINPPKIRKKVTKLVLKANKTANTLKKYSPDDDFIHGLILSLRIELSLINGLMQQKACWDMGFDLVGYEIDEDYFKKGVERVRKHTNQLQLF